MAKTREIQCIHYLYENNCALGKEGSFYGKCQTCNNYKKKPGAQPNRRDTRRNRLNRIERKERGDYL